MFSLSTSTPTTARLFLCLSLQQRHEVLLNRNVAALTLPNALLVIPMNSYGQLTSLFAVYTCLYYLLLLLLLQDHL